MSIVYINGEFRPIEHANVSVLDRGFLLGDGVYEVIPCYRSKLFRFEAHMQRFRYSMDAIRLDNPFDDEQWHQMLCQLIEQNGGGDLSIYAQITRGTAPRDHAFPKGVPPTVFAMANRFPEKDVKLLENGAKVITATDERWARCDIKAISLLANVLARQKAVEANSVETILIRDNYVTEGAASNVFIVKHGTLVTPPKGPYLLGGITRDLVLEIAQAHGIRAEERSIDRAELFEADEIWLTSSIREIVPVIQIDHHIISGGKPGPLWRVAHDLYAQFKRTI